MNRLATNADMLQGYITGTLSDAELHAFEDRLLHDVTLVQELEESLRLREGLEVLRARKELSARAPPRKVRLSPRLLGAAAAASILAVGLAFFYRASAPAIMAASPDSLHLNAQDGRKSKRYVFAKMRAAAETPLLELPTAGVLELHALTSAAAGGATFDVALEQVRAQSNVVLCTVRHIPADAGGLVGVYVDASALKPGEYALTVVPDGESIAPMGGNSGERFNFRLQRSM
jgi:hypothetical protein